MSVEYIFSIAGVFTVAHIYIYIHMYIIIFIYTIHIHHYIPIYIHKLSFTVHCMYIEYTYKNLLNWYIYIYTYIHTLMFIYYINYIYIINIIKSKVWWFQPGMLTVPPACRTLKVSGKLVSTPTDVGISPRGKSMQKFDEYSGVNIQKHVENTWFPA